MIKNPLDLYHYFIIHSLIIVSNTMSRTHRLNRALEVGIPSYLGLPNPITDRIKSVLNALLPIQSLKLFNLSTLQVRLRVRGGSHPPALSQRLINLDQSKEMKIGSLNVRSLKSEAQSAKLYSLLSYIYDNDFDIFMINEHWINTYKQLLNKLKYSNTNFLDKYTLYSDHKGDDQSYIGKETAMLISKSWIPYYQSTTRISGRLTCVTFKRLSDTVRVVSLYYPSNNNQTDSKLLNTNIQEILDSFPPTDKVVLAGDLNTTLNPSLDRVFIDTTTGEKEQPHQRQCLNPLFRSLVNPYNQKALTDIWRMHNPDKLEYTHSSTNLVTRTISKARLDVILVSQNLIPLTVSSNIIRSSEIDKSMDHDLITISISLPKSRLEAKYGAADTTTHYKINFDQITENCIRDYNHGLENDYKLTKLIATTTEASDILNIAQLTSYFSILRESIKRQANLHLPITKFVRSTGKLATKLKSHPRARFVHQSIKVINKLGKADELTSEDSQILQDIHNSPLDVHEEYINLKTPEPLSSQLESNTVLSEPELPLTPSLNTPTVGPNSCRCASNFHMIACTKSRLKAYLKHLKRKQTREVLAHRQKNTFKYQTNFIKSALDKTQTKFTLEYIKDPNSNDLTSDPLEVKEIIKNYYKDNIYGDELKN
jgi:exonuclease III